MTTEDTGRVASTAGLGLVERLRLIAAWNKPGGRVPDAPLPDKAATCLEAAADIERLRAAYENACSQRAALSAELDAAVAAERERWQRELDRMRDALLSIRRHCGPQPSALAAAIVATCDNGLGQPLTLVPPLRA